MASPSTVLALGYGSFGSVNLLPTLGYGQSGTIVDGPYRVEAGQAFIPGLVQGGAWMAGADRGQAYMAGAQEGATP